MSTNLNSNSYPSLNFFKRLKPADIKEIILALPKKVNILEVQTIHYKKLFKVCRIVKLLENTPDTEIASIKYKNEEEQNWTTSVCFHPSGEYVAVCGYNWISTIYYCNPLNKSKFGTELFKFTEHTFPVNIVTFSKSGNLFGDCSLDGFAFIYDFNERNTETFGKIILKIESETDIKTMSLSPSEDQVAIGTFDNSIFIYNITKSTTQNDATLLYTLKNHTKEVLSLCYSLCGKFLFSTSNDKLLSITDLQSEFIKVDNKGFTSNLQPQEEIALFVAVNPTNDFIALGYSTGKISLFKFNPYEKIMDLEGHTNDVNCLNFSPSGKYLASTGSDKFINIYDVDYNNIGETFGNLIKRFQGCYTIITGIAYSFSDEYIAISGYNQELKLFS